MMDVSLDTDITIHLFESGRQDLLFRYFEKVYIHEFVLEREMFHKSSETYKWVKACIDAGTIIRVDQRYLAEIGMARKFDTKREEIKILFDFGEANAVALAAVLGIAALVTDDTKDYGPHDTLVKEYVEDIIPFAFYELLYLDYLQQQDNAYEILKEQFEQINRIAYPEYPMGFVSRIKRVVRRFSRQGTFRDRNWMKKFCEVYEIDYSEKMRELKKNLENE